jgi:hypothetical protein
MDRSLGEPGAEIPEVVGQRRQVCRGVQRGLRDRGLAMLSLPVHGGNSIAKAHAADATLSVELGRDTGAAEELACRWVPLDGRGSWEPPARTPPSRAP